AFPCAFCVGRSVAAYDLVLVDIGRYAAAVLADKRAEIPLPNLFAALIERREHVMIGLVPNEVRALGVNRRRRGREAVELVPREWSQGKIFSPEHPPVICVKAQGRDAARFITSAREKNPVAPKNGRRMAAAGQFDFPIDVR